MDVIGEFKSDILQFIYTQLVSSGHVNDTGLDQHLSFIVNKKDKKTNTINSEYSVLIRGVDRAPETFFNELSARLLQASRDWTLNLQACWYSSWRLHLKLDRVSAFRMFIKQVLRLGEEYGRGAGAAGDSTGANGAAGDSTGANGAAGAGGVGRVSVLISDLLMHGADEEFTMSSLRSVLLAEHVRSLMIANGKKCEVVAPVRSNSAIINRLKELNIDFSEVSNETDLDSVRDRLTSNVHRIQDDDHDDRTVKISAVGVVQQEGLSRGKDGYNVNLETIEVDDKLMQAVADLCQHCHGAEEQVIHVVRSDHEYLCQKLDLLWRLTGGPRDQRHLVFGRVSGGGGGSRDACSCVEEFIRVRREQNREASEHKLGDVGDGDWTKRLDDVTMAGIKFELLSSNRGGEIKLDTTSMSGDHRTGMFVLYNYARLTALLRQYDKCVQQGVYPDWPCQDTVDWSQLREEEEWDLLLHYIMPYKSLVSQALCDTQTVQVRSSIQTHRVCLFLSQLCRLLSSYYNRFHVLGESRPHLYPKMHAQLYLLKAVQQIINNGLHLLNISPPEHRM